MRFAHPGPALVGMVLATRVPGVGGSVSGEVGSATVAPAEEVQLLSETEP
ncbi:hypothetical protein ACFWP7_03530 [Streptomyces sp. NPDC058470]